MTIYFLGENTSRIGALTNQIRQSDLIILTTNIIIYHISKNKITIFVNN